MYIARGGNFLEIGDMDVIVHENQIHMFYLNISGHDVVSHLVSDDGMHWKQLPNALYVGEPGECDDDMIWTMHAFKWNDQFYMLYTALAKENDGRLQKTALAVSDDLIKWEKVKYNPVIAPDPKWYEADLSGCGRADWRDPFSWVDEKNIIHTLVVAHEKEGPFNRRGCVAHATSEDGKTWTVKEPFYTPRISTDWEVPMIFQFNDKYYLLGHLCAPQLDIYRISDSSFGPWKRPLNDVLLPAPNHIFIPFKWQGKILVNNWIHVLADWNKRGPTRIIAPPKEIATNPDGTLHLKPFQKGWEAVSTTNWKSINSDKLVKGDLIDNCRCQKQNAFVKLTKEPGFGALLLPRKYCDFELEAVLSNLNAPEAGIVFRSDDQVDDYTRVSIIPGRQLIELVKITLPTVGHIIGRGHQTVQHNLLPLPAGTKIKLRIAAYGPYIEVSVNDRVYLASCTMSRREGRLGFFLEDGEIKVHSLKIRELEDPEMKLPPGPVK